MGGGVLAMIAAGVLSLAALAFDMTSVLARFYPGREKVVLTLPDGDTMTYVCKAGPAGETPQEQAQKAHRAFEANLEKFATALTERLLEDIAEDTAPLAMGMSTHLKAESWAGSITAHLEKEFGCALIG
jgi:hypothetical protein